VDSAEGFFIRSIFGIFSTDYKFSRANLSLPAVRQVRSTRRRFTHYAKSHLDNQRSLTPPTPPGVKTLVRIALPAIVLIFYVTASLHFAYTPDDTYIYLQFAKNIVRGDGFAFNAGEPTYGITSPLWVLLISAGGLFGLDLYIVAKVLDLVFASLALLVLYVFSLEVMRNHVAVLCATLPFSINIWFLRWAGTGMETSFAVLLLLLTLLYCLRNEYFFAIVVAALLTLTRPEAWLLTVLILLDVYVNSVDRRRGMKMALSLCALYGAFLLPWFAFAQLTFGTIIPNTALAKASFGLHVEDFTWTLTDIARTLAVSDGVAVVLLLVGVLILVRKRRTVISMDNDGGDEQPVSNLQYLRQHIVPLAWVIALPVLYILTNANVISRYLLLVTPVIIVYAFAVLWRILTLRGKERLRVLTTVVLTAVILAQNQFLYYKHVKPSIEAFTQGMQECFIPIALWLREHTPESTQVFVPDVGAIGYYSDRTICDPMGLVSPEFLPLLKSGYTLDRMMKEEMYRTMCQASYVAHRSFDGIAFASDELEPIMTRVVFGLGLSDPRTVYYTLYRVHQSPSE
jgi:hypothetical protein